MTLNICPYSLSPLVHIYHLLKVARVLFLLAFFRSFIRSFLSSLYSISLYSTIYIYCGGPPIRDLQYELVSGALRELGDSPYGSRLLAHSSIAQLKGLATAPFDPGYVYAGPELP